ncbi:hypothetical protein AAFG07_21320 [Bradyrhizobium sp. B097]|uniref:hypothetical protein n=1 Tax=Bradyrhizobium sp. B097 TaxID=3140244 RepID=UPI0031837B1D
MTQFRIWPDQSHSQIAEKRIGTLLGELRQQSPPQIWLPLTKLDCFLIARKVDLAFAKQRADHDSTALFKGSKFGGVQDSITQGKNLPARTTRLIRGVARSFHAPRVFGANYTLIPLIHRGGEPRDTPSARRPDVRPTRIDAWAPPARWLARLPEPTRDTVVSLPSDFTNPVHFCISVDGLPNW